MPKLTMETSHELGQEEAIRRLKERFSLARQTYGSHLSQFDEQWDDDEFTFGFTAVGMKVAGRVSVGDDAVRLDANLPLAAMMFKGMIEQRIREELNELLG